MSTQLKKKDISRNQELMKKMVAAQVEAERCKADLAIGQARVVELKLELDMFMYDLRQKYGLKETDSLDYSGKVIARPEAVRQINEEETLAKIEEMIGKK